MLVDDVKIYIRSGDGGAGVISFRREKYVPRGGPNGGDGGKGGDIVIRANPNLNTLNYFQQHVHFKAKAGGRGGTSNKTGANADTLFVDVPVGTVIKDIATDDVIADLAQPDDVVVVLKGGRGGKGNTRFTSASNRAPRIAEKGAPGEEMWIRLELRLIADVGLVGVPNAGKSTLLSVVSNAKPKIADYPFTTLAPNLGVVIYDHRDLVFADIPGLIEGASQGIGLGHSFLRHVSRCRVLIHVIDGMSDDPVADYNQINTELALYDEALAKKPQIVVFNKMDLPDAQEYFPLVKEALEKRGVEVMPISAVAHQNVQQVIQRSFMEIDNLPEDMKSTLPAALERYTLGDNEPIFNLKKRIDGAYIVTGKRIERAAAMTYWDYDEAVLRFQKILEILGVTKALKDAGAVPGDTVFIGEYELEWAD
ncbi:MAG: GTPase ObgE [Anaerolineae bacterium]|nr:GTPase ObgE [Anaerolineae bacterium]MDQ7036731.1 GTPase ObgE [Anaerolineae bacterium]